MPPPEPVTSMDDAGRTAFWVNAYNETLVAELAATPRTGTLLRHRRLFRKPSTTVDGLPFSLDQIEHGLLRGNRRPPYSPRRVLRRGDPQLRLAPSRPDPRIHFALNCGARSCPPVRTYTAAAIDAELAAATRGYLEAEARLDRDAGVLTLPGLIKLYRRDFGDRAERLAFVAAHWPGPDGPWLAANAADLRIAYDRFDWRLAAPGAAASAQSP